MKDCLIEGLEDFTTAYLDDLVIYYSENWEEHLQCVLHKLQQAGLTAKPAKCQFAMAQCTYLGHIVVYCDVFSSVYYCIWSCWFSFLYMYLVVFYTGRCM